jgi:acetyltransferase-like isoleucine patch superfamily enzyme
MLLTTTAKSRIRNIFNWPPRGMRVGTGTIIQRPHRISAPECIDVGSRTLISRGALVQPILSNAGVTYTPKIKIGDDVYIGPNVYLAAMGGISIGDGSVLSESVYMNDATHGMDPEAGLIMQQKLVHRGDIQIGKRCFLGLRCAIMPGVTLGDHCIVGINSVVTKSFPAFCMVVGAPARIIKVYSRESGKWEKWSLE